MFKKCSANSILKWHLAFYSLSEIQTVFLNGTLNLFYHSDNVPLTAETCKKFCIKHNVKTKECDELCSPKLVRCSHWPDSSKCLKMLQNADKNNAKNAMLTTSDHENNNPSNSVVMKRDTLAQDIILTGYLQNTFISQFSFLIRVITVTCKSA